MQFHALVIESIQAETDVAVSISLTVPATLSKIFTWQAGQHVQVKLFINGVSYIRYYSISQGQQGHNFSITVKQQKDGVVSPYLNNQLKQGDLLEVSQPMGRFCVSAAEKNRKSYYFFTLGSGITPIFNMINTLLKTEKHSHLYLLYGNKNHDSAIFCHALTSLQQQYTDRFTLLECHSNAKWLSSYTPWHFGRIDQQRVQAFIREYPPQAHDVEYYLCGTGDFIMQVEQALMAIDVPNIRIYSEGFTRRTNIETSCVAANLQVRINGNKHQLPVAAGQTLLQAMKNKGLNVPYSCEAGLCGRCRCHLDSGQVDHGQDAFLSEKERAKGDILACQSTATTSEITISYQK
ncbi:MAG: 2Fe-2S iron-sulfur cluster-binding protein [Parashewanella sp.]